MKNYIILLIIGLCSIDMQAQQVVATSGNPVQKTAGSISWTLGETVIATLTSNDKVLNQGFQQGSTVAAPQLLNQSEALKVTVWPNPANDKVVLSVEKFEGLRYHLFDINGNLLQSKNLTDKTTIISFGNLTSGSYIIDVLKEKTKFKTFTIVKP